MKKLLFTAIAVVGFGMNSWGHTIEKDVNEIIELSSIRKIEIFKSKVKTNDQNKISILDHYLAMKSEITSNRFEQCFQVYQNYYNYYVNYLGNQNSDLARTLATGHYQNCMYGNEGGKQIGVLC